MTLTPAQHYARADELVAELEQADPRVGMSLAHVQLKFRLAELHAQLAQSPWWPDLFSAEHPDPWPDDEVPNRAELDELRDRIVGPPIETRSATGDRL
ncbi:hypothetical protein [Mycolicibacterium fortuitum]|uniref:hypothetical protein n=1 Tax=Mycolicibacterium fortuitum TaxID=1766 RepID=UPI00096D1314|nr:hypothetical protein [Mycolicibacterium fortuitum]OMC07076.1 hypothetical protein A5734_03695 [Mycolicibacterium fortuitum]